MENSNEFDHMITNWQRVLILSDHNEKIIHMLKNLQKNKEAFLAERICILFREQYITIISVLTADSMTIETIALAISGAFGRWPTAPGS